MSATPSLQSGFRPGHSTETAILLVLSKIIQAVDSGDFAALVLLDLSAAFDTVDHEKLLQRLHISYCINRPVLQWFRSYLVGRTQHVHRGSTISSAVHLACGVPQGSVIGPILFVLYTADLIALMSLGLSPHLYADDNQIYGCFLPSHVDVFLATVTGCVNAVADCIPSNRLQLNNDKTEFMWCATVRRQHHLPTSGPTIGSLSVTPSLVVPDLGVCIDSDLSMRSQVQLTASRCFAVLRQLRAIRRQVPTACSVPVDDYCTSPVSIGLLQQRLVRTSRQPHPASSVGPERCCTAHLPYPTV